DISLCHGWIDGQARSLDATYYLQRFTPRRKKSLWSRINVDKVARLVAEGRMRPAGLAEVERAKADGRWDQAYAGPATMEVPVELAALLEGPAAALFEALDKTNRYAFCQRVATAVKAETRRARAERLVEQLLAGILPYPAKKAASPKPPKRPSKKAQSRDS
ncbi:MAG TPA: YdeI/OmpD-associated family protein, partial [Myxococcota bacterium]|nr:YdeI/OmpD-associated family protein [Myxococcota bacterium]